MGGSLPGALAERPALRAQGAQDTARTKGGLGLGLSLVKGLVELHGGSVRASSAGAGRGSELVVKLPLAEPPPAAKQVDRQGGPSRLVLIVEDNPTPDGRSGTCSSCPATASAW